MLGDLKTQKMIRYKKGPGYESSAAVKNLKSQGEFKLKKGQIYVIIINHYNKGRIPRIFMLRLKFI
jgi:hypothetical protein